MVRQIQDKFEIDADVEIQVFDRENNQYFHIDASEVREIRNGGKIKVTKMKGGRGGGSAPKKAKGSPMKPPGVPPPTKEDDAKRSAWRKGSRVEIYSESERKWIKGEIVRIYNDREGEWLVIRYSAARTKEIQRFSNYVRPVQPPKKAKKARDGRDTKKERDSPKKEGKKKEREPRAPKVVKVTTQSKYKRQKRVPAKEERPENVVEFKGNNGHIKQHIDRACMLLRGPRAVPEEEVKADAAEEVKADGDEKQKGPWQPAQKWDAVHLVGSGRAMAHVVSAAEIVKRIVPGLHQQTQMETNTIVDGMHSSSEFIVSQPLSL